MGGSLKYKISLEWEGELKDHEYKELANPKESAIDVLDRLGILEEMTLEVLDNPA